MLSRGKKHEEECMYFVGYLCQVENRLVIFSTPKVLPSILDGLFRCVGGEMFAV